MVRIIAEVGINHGGNVHLAHEMIRKAKECGADVAKFQCYSVDALFGKSGEDPNEEIYNMVKPLELNKKQLQQIKNWCDEEDIEFACSVFDEERLRWIEEMGVGFHKIASRTAKLTPDLAVKIAEIGKPCYMSLGFGASKLDQKYGNVEYLYCVSEYPTEYSSLSMPREFGLRCEYQGFSDHSMGIGASLIAVARGAMIIEKHFTLNKSNSGPDHVCSIDPGELRNLVKYSREISKINRLAG